MVTLNSVVVGLNPSTLVCPHILTYCHLLGVGECAKNSKIQNGRHFWRENFNFFFNWHGYYPKIPCGSKILLKSLYLARFLRYKHFYVLQFCEKFENSKWPPFLARQNFFENWHGYSAVISCGSKVLSKSLYLARFSRYKHFCAFFIWKIHND